MTGRATPASDTPGARASLRAIPANVKVAGLISLFTDLSSEMIVPVLPLFLSTVLGAAPTAIGVIEGIAESTASVLRVFAGWISDRLGRRKVLVILGYSLSNVAKPLLALAGSWPQVLVVRFADRFGKGIRGAPRDALIADSVPAERRGLAFGFHRSMDTLGAALGPLLAFGVLALLPDNYRAVFWVAAIPGAIAIAIGVLFLRDVVRPPGAASAPKLGFGGLGRGYSAFTLVATLFALGNSSDAFLILRTKNLGLSATMIPLVYFAFNAIYASLSTPLGALSDRIGRRAMLIAGYAVFALVYLGFGLASGAGGRLEAVVLFLVYGTYYALTEGAQRALIIDLVPVSLRATALGTFSTITGLALLPASLIAGLLWDHVGPAAPFFYGAALASLAAALLILVLPRTHQVRA